MSHAPRIANWREMHGKPPAARLFSSALLPVLGLRFIGHLPYFKIGSDLLLPQPLGLGSAAAAALVYSVACLGVSRWLSRRQRLAGQAAPLPITLPLIGAVALLAVMLLAGPAIAQLLSATSDAPMALMGGESRFAALFPGWLCLLLPVVSGFLAVQILARRQPG